MSSTTEIRAAALVRLMTRYDREISNLERENLHLKEMLADMADAMYQDKRHHELQPELEHLVIKWMERCNAASVRAIAAQRGRVEPC